MRNWDPKLLEQLLQVQEIDLKIRGLSREIEEIYRKSKEEDPQIVAAKIDLKKIEEGIETAETQHQMYIDTLEDIRTAIKGLATTKSGTPKPRTRSSTEALRIEEEKLALMIVEIENQIKSLNVEKKRLTDYIDERSRSVEALQQGPEAEIRKVKARIRRLENQRGDAVKGIPSQLLRKYERLQGSRSGIGLTILRDGVCTVCRMQMPTATNSRLTYGEHIPVCPACGRIVARVDFIEMQRVPLDYDPSAPTQSTDKLKKKKAEKTSSKKKPAAKPAAKTKPKAKAGKKKAPAKKAPAKKAPAKKAPAKKAPAKKAPAKKAPAKKAPAKKAPAKKAPAKKAPAKKAPAKKAPAKKTKKKAKSVKK